MIFKAVARIFGFYRGGGGKKLKLHIDFVYMHFVTFLRVGQIFRRGGNKPPSLLPTLWLRPSRY